VGTIVACGLVATVHEVLIHRIEWYMQLVSVFPTTVHLFTPLQTYTPFDVASNAFFAWWQGAANAGDTGKLGRTFGAGGLGSAHQVVNVNGVPITTFGPSQTGEQFLGGSWALTREPKQLWGAQDPPFRLKPGAMAVVQGVAVSAGSSDVLTVNFWYTERAPQGDVG
jgi:hypothetical protein